MTSVCGARDTQLHNKTRLFAGVRGTFERKNASIKQKLVRLVLVQKAILALSGLAYLPRLVGRRKLRTAAVQVRLVLNLRCCMFSLFRQSKISCQSRSITYASP